MSPYTKDDILFVHKKKAFKIEDLLKTNTRYLYY